MSPTPRRDTLLPVTEAPWSEERDLPPFAGSLSLWRDARHPGLNSHAGVTITAREREVLAMISRGLSNKHIARTLEISPETVKSHVKHIFSKLSVSTRTEAVFWAVSLELL